MVQYLYCSICSILLKKKKKKVLNCTFHCHRVGIFKATSLVCIFNMVMWMMSTFKKSFKVHNCTFGTTTVTFPGETLWNTKCTKGVPLKVTQQWQGTVWYNFFWKWTKKITKADLNISIIHIHCQPLDVNQSRTIRGLIAQKYPWKFWWTHLLKRLLIADLNPITFWVPPPHILSYERTAVVV